eukprot:TRINITY_DN18874_c1_g1_i1.p1 TRINITY_DN18874_c1_g1~~TRINITY_DN18874_c1_g1_i1.p1  ORF type:complete len:332 (+),score=82.81 TRINITY_DN18874_c1_g1_i1:63-1058(+)
MVSAPNSPSAGAEAARRDGGAGAGEREHLLAQRVPSGPRVSFQSPQRQPHGHSHSHSHSHGPDDHAHSHGRKAAWVDLHFGGLSDDPAAETFRESLFGVCDGMLNNAGLIFGAAAISRLDVTSVTIIGVVGLLAGTTAMALCQLLAQRLDTQRERDDLEIETEHLRKYPEEEDAELLKRLEKFGFSAEAMEAIRADMERSGDTARLRLHAKFELGVDVDRWLDPNTGGLLGIKSGEVVKDPISSSARALVCYFLGSAIPLWPWLIPGLPAHALAALALSLLSVCFCLVVEGFFVSRFTGSHPWVCIQRQLCVGLTVVGIVVVAGFFLSLFG